MPNKKGGKKFKRGKKNIHETKLIYRDPKEDQEYGKVINVCGNGRFNIQCFDGKDRLGILAGNMRKKVWVNKDDIVLISRWEFSTDSEKCSIIHKYNDDDVKKLQSEKEFPSTIQLDSHIESFDDSMIIFDDSLNDININSQIDSQIDNSDKSDSDSDSDSFEKINFDEI